MTDKWDDNVPGKFAVNVECIDCDFCRETAPDFFRRSPDGYSYVYKQPEQPSDLEKCFEACEGCPVSAIEAD